MLNLFYFAQNWANFEVLRQYECLFNDAVKHNISLK
jgi:hypothetical protein